MPSLKEEVLKIDIKQHKIEMGVWVFNFQDHNFRVAYMPVLNLSGYGETDEEAAEMLFQEVTEDFFKTLFKLSEAEIMDKLYRYGWRRNKIFRKKFVKSPSADKEFIIKNFNLPAETPITQQYIAA